MARVEFDFATQATLRENGDYRMSRGRSFNTVNAEWITPGITPAGVLTFSVNGDPGDPSGVMDLSTPTRVLSVGEARLSHIDITLSGLPAGGAVVLRIA